MFIPNPSILYLFNFETKFIFKRLCFIITYAIYVIIAIKNKFCFAVTWFVFFQFILFRPFINRWHRLSTFAS